MKDLTKSTEWQNLGALALGSRLKKLSDTIFQQGQEIYDQQGLSVSSRYFPILHQLSRQEPLSVSQIAERLNLSHAAIVQTLNLMKKDGITIDRPSPTDSRKSELYLTPSGRELIKKLEPIWMQIWKIMNQLVGDHTPALLAELDALEQQLESQTLAQRFSTQGTSTESSLEITTWSPRYHAAFTDLNEEWLRTFFTIEAKDRRILDFPEKEIIEPGGMIFFARRKGLTAGTCALIATGKDSFELGKMAVAPDLQGHGIGRALLDFAVAWAKKRGAKRITLESSKKLGPALKLYTTSGFTDKKPEHPSAYNRADVFMELKLT